MNFEETMQKSVNAKAKADLKSSTMASNSDIRCLRDYRPFNSTVSKVRTQGTIAKDFHPKEPKVKEVRPTSSRTVEAISEPLKQAYKKKKRKKQHKKQNKKKQTPASTTIVI